jgi:hypothetical protein
VSEIDFNEIEKAMAELVKKAQGQKRENQLDDVAKARDEQARKVDTARDQGNIATKRIIVGGTKLRTEASRVNAPRVFTPRPENSSNAGNLINDFRPTAANQPTPQPAPAAYSSSPKEEDNLTESVGNLSDQYLVDEVNADQVNKDVEPIQTDQVEEGTQVDESAINPEQSVSNLPSEAFPEEPQAEENVSDPAPLEDLNTESELPEVEQVSSDLGRVHKLYGQRLPKEYLEKSFEKREGGFKDSKLEKGKQDKAPKGPKAKRGILFYSVILLILASCSVWGVVAYLYFAY